MARLAVLLLVAAAAVTAVVVARAADGARPGGTAAGATSRADGGEAPRRRSGARRSGAAPSVPRLRCPDGVPDCRAVRGPIIFVEAVDPDGDGDLHVVIAAGGVTAPGLTAVDVRRGLRPRRDPRPGDLASAAGPVQIGSFGQSQIHALAFRTARGSGRVRG